VYGEAGGILEINLMLNTAVNLKLLYKIKY
jgi:hypothetical protein